MNRIFPAVLASGLAVAALLACSSSTDNSSRSSGSGPAGDAGPDVLPPGDAAADTAPSEAGGDAGTKCTINPFAGCTTFDDRTADGADRKVAFKNFEYTPKCLRIKAGQTVTFEGDFGTHPLVTSCGPALAMDKRSGVGAAPFVLSGAGLYGYYCLDHGNAGGDVMSGAIDVVP